MRTIRVYLAALSLTFAAVSPLRAAGSESVAVQYHFAGAEQLSHDTNFHAAGQIFHASASVHFEGLVLNRLARQFWNKFHFDPRTNAGPTLVPILGDLLYLESVGSFDATGDNFVVAARMDQNRTQAWRQKLDIALRGKGSAMSGITGQRWDNGFWTIEKPGWFLIGKGDRMNSVRDDYLRQIQIGASPGPALKNGQWLAAMVDWPQLSAGNLPREIPLKPARSTVDISASGGRFHITAELRYPEPVNWSPKPWRIPKELICQPLISFTAAQGVASYMQLGDVFSKLPTDPFTEQFYCWAQREMPFQSYMAWPVDNGAKVIKELGAKGPGIVNPILQSLDRSQVEWVPGASEVTWKKSPIMGPFLKSVSEKEGDYLLAGLFPQGKNQSPAPAALWNQFEGHGSLVYYNWELTGVRIHEWRLYSELMPEMLSVTGRPGPRFAEVENWLDGLEPALGNTVTEVTRTSPDTLTITRSAPFVFTGMELVWLSHWLTGEPAGPLNMKLLPKAKITGPGILPQ
ncbi:MAG TPA: hypothetical protein VGN61_02155 [Verrucomicrobiae bacterium]